MALCDDLLAETTESVRSTLETQILIVAGAFMDYVLLSQSDA